MSAAAAFLRNVPVLAGLDDESLERLAGQVRGVHVRAGDWVMRQGDPAESLFIVRTGRLEVVDEGPPETLIRMLRRGDVLGELALLRQGTRSASVRARRDAAGVRFDRIAGVSLGSLVAAAAAAGFTLEGMREAFEQAFVHTNPTNDFVPPAFSLVRGAKTRRLLDDNFGDRRIEELPLRFFCLSCDLIARESVLHRSGPVADAVYPSLAIPGVFPPVATDDGRLLVDGAVLDNLPVATMARAGEGPVIAVDVTGRMGQFRRRQAAAVARLGRPVRRLLTGSEAEVPRLGETLVRTVTVGSIDTVAAARMHADLVITPPVEGIALMDWKALPRVRELGRQAARDALAADPEVAGRLGLG